MSGYRLPDGGRLIDRTRRVSFTFDGAPENGFAGDTLASALLASGRTLFGRSFKYHRPRGILTAGEEEPNALVNLHTGGRTDPNAKAPVVELFDGLTAASQNRWPSLDTDLMAVNSLLSPFFVAGFYYKTFMGHGQRTWHFFEHFIRRAAGQGSVTLEADPDRYERTNAFTDVLVVGAGAAGLMAAREAAATGRRVMLIDNASWLGGSLFAESGHIDGQTAADWADGMVADLTARDNVTLLPRTGVYGYFDGNMLAAVERVSDHLAAPAANMPRQRHWAIRAGSVVIATGALERPIVFDGNDTPGVMLASAALAYAARYGVAVGRRVVLFGNNDTVHAAAIALHDRGVAIAAVVDPRPAAADATLQAALAARGIAIRFASVVAKAEGGKTLRAVTIAPVDGSGTNLLGAGEPLECDALAVSGGWMPNIPLCSQAGSNPVFDEALQAFVPGRPREAWRAAGAAAGILDLAGCLADGAKAGRLAAGGNAGDAGAIPVVSGALGVARPLPLWEVPAVHGRGKKFVDYQHDVTAEDVRLAYREGYRSVEHLKRYTTLGMATDQGKNSNLNGLALMAIARGEPIPRVGTTRFRAPCIPVALGALAGRDIGAHFKPERRTPMHEVHLEAGAEMTAAGLWKRPRVYAQAGETVKQAYIREARAVRSGVGMIDVTSLGKIDVQGPDAAVFLDRVYANNFLKLPVGKARYGIMLRDDGMMFDDGTTWRLSETQYLMTTTTARAAAVLSHLEFLLAAVWPDLRVQVTSVTDQWAGIAVAGPESRAVLQGIVEGLDLADGAFPIMAVGDGRIRGTPVKIARLSFSGELAFEVYCGSFHGAALWKAIAEAGKPFGMVPYGTEALGTLRIEKGHISGPELEGRTTLGDVGLQRMASKTKEFVGSVLMNRPGLTDPGRAVMVGLVAHDDTAFRAGAHLIERDGGKSIGHVSSVTYSPALERHIGLALLAGGRERLGSSVIVTDPVRTLRTTVDVVDPCFHDKDGSRMHA